MNLHVENLKRYFPYFAIILVLIVSLLILAYTNKSDDLGGQESSKTLDDVKGVQVVLDDCSVTVDVSGAVKKPAVYCLKENSILFDAIKAAGGFNIQKYSELFVRSSINLAKKIENNEKIYIPFKDDVVCKQLEVVRVEKNDPQKQENNSVETKCISLNTATISELDILDGVGPSTAQKIIDARPYKSVNDLQNVSGIGGVLFNKIKEKICL